MIEFHMMVPLWIIFKGKIKMLISYQNDQRIETIIFVIGPEEMPILVWKRPKLKWDRPKTYKF